VELANTNQPQDVHKLAKKYIKSSK